MKIFKKGDKVRVKNIKIRSISKDRKFVFIEQCAKYIDQILTIDNNDEWDTQPSYRLKEVIVGPWAEEWLEKINWQDITI